MRLKRMISFSIGVMVAFSLVGCGNSQEISNNVETEAEREEESEALSTVETPKV